MISPKSTRLALAGFCAVILLAFGISRFAGHESPAASVPRSQAHKSAAIPETAPAQTGDTSAAASEPSAQDAPLPHGISAFREWAETSAASGFADADETTGMELAKARAVAMKELIRKNPAAALRETLPADLRDALPAKIAAAIEQPVETTGMCSIRMMCKHSTDADHGDCESTPVLLEDLESWNAHYVAGQWREYLGQNVKFEGISVGEELAVKSITPVPSDARP